MSEHEVPAELLQHIQLVDKGTASVVKFEHEEDGTRKEEPFETVTWSFEGGKILDATVVRHYESDTIPEESRAKVLGEDET